MRLFRLAAPLAVLAAGLAFAVTALSQKGCPSPAPSEGLRLAVERRADHALIADASVQLAEAAPVFLEYGSPEVGWLRTPTTTAGTTHQLPILRLRPTTTYQARAFALDRGGCPAGLATAEFRTGELPLEFETSLIRTSGQPSLPLTLIEHRIVNPDARVNLAWLVMLDERGTPVWYYEVPRALLEPVYVRKTIPIVQRPNRNILYLSGRVGFEEITPAGQSVRRILLGRPPASQAHHDFALLPDGRVLFLGIEERSVAAVATIGQPVRVLGDTLHLLDLDSGTEQQVWSAFDALDPLERPAHWRAVLNQFDDWTHGNTVSLGPRGNVLLSFRQLDQVISLSPDYRTIEWRLGGVASSFAFPDPSDQFYGQHTVAELVGNRVLLFDNGNFRPDGKYSRGLELELDFAGMTARKVWEYRPPNDFYAEAVSSTVRLPNGNTLLNFGFRLNEPGAPYLLAEARPDGSAAWEHWRTWRHSPLPRYRAYPVGSIAGETPVEPTRY